jgi:hypothetical protein
MIVSAELLVAGDPAKGRQNAPLLQAISFPCVLTLQFADYFVDDVVEPSTVVDEKLRLGRCYSLPIE